MSAPAFDTAEYCNTLKEAGVPEQQAEGHLKGLKNVTNNLATKQDILATRQDLKNVKTELGAEIDKLDTKIDSVQTKLGAKIDRKANYLVLSIIGIILGVKLFEFIF